MNFTAGGLNSKTPNYRPGYDDRKGLGYGLLEPQFHVARSQGGQFPYLDPDDFEIDEEEDMGFDPGEMDAFVAKLNKQPAGTGDSLGYLHADPFYYFGPNTPARPLAGEAKNIPVNAKLASPIPKGVLYPNGFDAALGGGTSMPIPHAGPTLGFYTLSRPTGSKQGYADPPPQPAAYHDELDEPVYHLEDLPEPGQRTINKLRKVISLIHAQQDLAERYAG